MPQTVIENPIINSPFTEPIDISDSPTRASPTRSSPDAESAPISSRSPGRRKKASNSFSIRNGRRTASRRTDSSIGSASGWSSGARGLRRRHADTRHLLELLDRSRPREEALLLPDRGPGNRHLHHRGRRRNTATPGSRTHLREANDTSNPGLPRIAFKMATGSGKTVVMAMLIAWHALNKLREPQDARFSDTFLIVTPGHHHPRPAARAAARTTPSNYYRQRDICPGQLLERARPGQDRHHELSRLPSCARQIDGRQADEGDSRGRPRPVRSPRRPTRWSAASAGSWATRRTSSSSTTRPTTATAASPTASDEKLTGEERDEAEKRERRGPDLDFRPRGRQSQDRRARPSTTFRPRPSSSAAPATPKARSSPGWSPTSR